MAPHTDSPDVHDELRALRRAEIPEVEKMAAAFAAVTGRIVEMTRRDIELASALGDRELKIKHQIKLETMNAARQIFQGCYRYLVGRRAWDERDGR
jgi:hypothetical protein